MGKDDWKYDEDAWNEMGDEGKKAAPSPEKQCAQCLHWVCLLYTSDAADE